MWGGTTNLEHFLQSQGMVSLLFCGVNSDQCVAGVRAESYIWGDVLTIPFADLK